MQTTPEVAYERVLKRGRKEEQEISFEYVKELHDHHEKWLIGNNYPKDAPVSFFFLNCFVIV